MCVCGGGGRELHHLHSCRPVNIHMYTPTRTDLLTHPPNDQPTHTHTSASKYGCIYTYMCMHVYVYMYAHMVTICVWIFIFYVDVFVKEWWGGGGPMSGVSRAACKLMETTNGTDTATSSSTILDTAAANRKIQKQQYGSKQFSLFPHSHYLSFPPRIRQPNPLKFSDLRHELCRERPIFGIHSLLPKLSRFQDKTLVRMLPSPRRWPPPFIENWRNATLSTCPPFWLQVV